MGTARISLRLVAISAVGALALAACGGGSDSGSSSSGKSGATKGGTLTFLTNAEQFNHLDPQRNYTGEDLAFSSAYLTRTLTAYKVSADGKTAGGLVGDLATDTGKPTNGGKTWAFTLRDGIKWQDGSDVTCADIKYGVSRTFAQSTITDGPTYAISLLDIPKAKDGTSVYKGPYETSGNDTAAFDKAVQCSSDGKTITFNLRQAAGDFNYTVTLTAFAPVPKAKDTGEKYDDNVVSNAPYKITEYTKGQQLVLERNTNWSASSDSYRGAYPDKIIVKFSIEPTTIDQRMMADAGDDQTAISRDPLDTSSLTTVFNDPRFADRRVNDYDAYVRYIAINTKKVPNVKQRQAILAATDRAALRTIAGGSFAGDLADGVIKPNLTLDYAKSGMWDGMYGAAIPDTGNVDLAKQLIAQSGAPMPAMTYQYIKTPVNDKMAASLQSSLARAGIKIKLTALPQGEYYSIVQDTTKEEAMAAAGWGPDWLNASTVIPELFTQAGGFNLSQVDDKAFTAASDAAKGETDRNKQADAWKSLNKQAMQQAWVLPTRFARTQRLAGSKVKAASGPDGHVYIWSPYGSWSYTDLYVE
ncbi:ABC transporter substrate-binding protein [Angustibacter sp. McL0619]|uniref:ABC transporter substrate-binding protein n=1 Tax=Angustibacter sp. McL0619 TaxID=3415676 RepID=UPI003CE71638